MLEDAQPAGVGELQVIIRAGGHAAFQVQEIVHHAVDGDGVGGEEQAVRRVIVEGGPGVGRLVIIVVTRPIQGIANGQDGLVFEVGVVENVHQPVVGGKIAAIAQVDRPVHLIAAVDRAEVVFKAQRDARHAMFFHDRHVDQVGGLDERIADWTVGDGALGRHVEMHALAGAVTQGSRAAALIGVELHARVQGAHLIHQAGWHLAVVPAVGDIVDPDISLRHADGLQPQDDRIDRLRQGIDDIVVVGAAGVVEVYLDRHILTGAVAGDEGAPGRGAAGGAGQFHHPGIGHLVDQRLADIIAVPAFGIVPKGGRGAVGVNDAVGGGSGGGMRGNLPKGKPAGAQGQRQAGSRRTVQEFTA